MKALKPSHREKKRYLLISGKDANQNNIEQTILEYIGILGFADVSPQIIKKKGNNVILAINLRMLEKVRASFLMSNKSINIDNVSGMINNL